MSTTHQYVPPGSDNVSFEVSRDEWLADHLMPPWLVFAYSSGYENANIVPAAGVTQEFENHEAEVDLTNATKAFVSESSEYSVLLASELAVQFDPKVGGAYAGNWVYLDAVNGPFVSMNAQGPLVGAEVNIAAASKTVGRVRWISRAGNGSNVKTMLHCELWVR